MTTTEALAITGGLSDTDKMPEKSHGIPTRYCITGMKLRDVEGSICADCYACKGRSVFKNVQTARERRYQALQNPMWVDGMVFQLRKMHFFRWFDSGDLQGLWHLEQIIDVCRKTPHCKHWISTREYKFVREWVEKHGEFPKNVVVRLSAYMFDEPGPENLARRLGVNVSTATTRESKATCPAYKQGGKCGGCRKCWKKRVFSVTYKRH